MKHLVIFILAVLLSSCGVSKMVPYQEHREIHDSERVSTQRLDSLFKAAIQRDSIYVRDSIYMYVKGDTVTHYVEKIRYQYKNRTDTVYRNILRCDTLYIERTDSCYIVQPCYIDKPIKWYNKGFIWVGRICCLAAILWALFLYLKRKF